MKKMTYEQAITRLALITSSLEDGSLSLDESLKLFEEASSLVTFCNDCLDKAEQKIVELSEKGENKDE